MITTWQKEITYALKENGETWDDVIACTLSPKQRDIEFDNGYGTSCGKAFTAWTKYHVYFPAVYDGSEWVESVPRNPCDVAKEHVGGQ